ncbi:MAG: carboxypeptidase regulatory-like domain-containing protein [Vicinamibacterales bacterium]
MGRLSVRGLGLAFVFLLVTSTGAFAQSAISGLVRDTSGAVMPGVTVDAASPVLIEKVRSVVSDDQGRYTIIDLRPGTYTVTFTLPGFNTYVQEGLELPANFTATVNAEMRVGALEESVTVTGAAPVLDVQNTQRQVVLNRELMDAVPSARNYSGLASLMPGVRMSNTDVGGNQQMEQIYMTVNGSRQTDTTVQVDGMSLNSLMNDGQVQAYFSDAAMAEVTYQTSGVTADISTGGVRINMIPKDGGNVFSGQAFVGGTDGDWQANNVTDELRSRGLGRGSRVAKIQDINFGVGGPIKKDKLWFFASWRRIATDSVIPGSYFASTGEVGTGIEDQWIQNQMVRLTWQINQKNKFSIYHDRYPKFKGHEVTASIVEWDTAAGRRDPEHALYYTGQAKWTSTLSNKLLLEAGYSTNVEYLFIGYQPGVQKERNTPDWFTTIGKQDLITLRAYDGRPGPANGIDPKAYNVNTILSYVTGSHALKTGFNWTFGDYVLEYDINGDLVQLYRNGVPDSVRVYNTPVRANEYLNANLGMFVQDAWTVNRMTLNMGVRLERFVGQIKNQEIGEGRFAPARTFNEVTGLPSWFDVSPRLGVSYDLFGTGRTALKATFGRYMAGQTTSFPARYNPLQLQSDTRSWRDLNGDNIAQNNEIGPSNNAAFGLPVQTVRPDPDIKREYDLEYTAQVQHEVIQGLSLSFGYYRRGTHNQRVTRNRGWSDSDYTVVNVVSPLDGTVIPVYNLNPALRGNVDRIDENSTNSDLRRRSYNGFQTGFNARVAGFQFFGGWTMDRIVDVRCDAIESNQGRYAGTAAIGASNQPQPDFHWCDQSQLDMPFLHEFKVAGSYTLPWYGIQTNIALQSYNGQPLFTRWNIGQATRYAANCVGPCRPGELVVPNLTLPNYVVDLVAPGQRFYDRQNQIDMGFRKVFRVGRYQVSGQVDLFNIINSSYVKSQNITYAVQSPTASFNTFGQPLDILQPRTVRLAAQLKF